MDTARKASELKALQESCLRQIDAIVLGDPSSPTGGAGALSNAYSLAPAPVEVGKAEARPAAADGTAPPPMPEPPPMPAPPPAPPAAERPTSRTSVGGAGKQAGWNRRLWVMLAAASCGLGLIGLRQWNLIHPAEVHRTFPLPFTYSVGLVAHRGLLHSVDRKRLLLYSFSEAEGSVVGLQKFSAASPTGLGAGEACFWSSDAEKGSVFQHNLDSDHTIRRTLTSKDRRPTALYWDGSHLWNADAHTETVYEYTTGDSLLPARQFTLPGLAISGLYVSDGVLWALDTVTRRVFRYKLRTLPIALDDLRLDDWLPATSQVTGMAVEGSALWLMTERPAELHRLDLTKVSWSPRHSGRSLD